MAPELERLKVKAVQRCRWGGQACCVSGGLCVRTSCVHCGQLDGPPGCDFRCAVAAESTLDQCFNQPAAPFTCLNQPAAPSICFNQLHSLCRRDHLMERIYDMRKPKTNLQAGWCRGWLPCSAGWLQG